MRTVELSFVADFLISSTLINPNLQDVPMQTGEIVMDICHIGASFIRRSWFWGTIPNFFTGQKNRNFTMGPTEIFSKPKICDAQRYVMKIIVIAICDVGAGLIGRS